MASHHTAGSLKPRGAPLNWCDVPAELLAMVFSYLFSPKMRFPSLASSEVFNYIVIATWCRDAICKYNITHLEVACRSLSANKITHILQRLHDNLSVVVIATKLTFEYYVEVAAVMEALSRCSRLCELFILDKTLRIDAAALDCIGQGCRELRKLMIIVYAIPGMCLFGFGPTRKHALLQAAKELIENGLDAIRDKQAKEEERERRGCVMELEEEEGRE